MASNIGIKIANGEFYSLVEENSSVKKRLILTTVHDNQPSVQIDLYRSNAGVMSDAQYIGSLVVENIQPKQKGEPSIEMVISSNVNGEIIADAIDLDSGAGGEHHVLTVSLQSLDESSREMEIPDFELESNEEPPSSLYRRAEQKQQEKKGKSLLWLLILLLLLIAGLAAWIFLFGGDKVLGLSKGTSPSENKTQTETQVRAQPESAVTQESESAPSVTAVQEPVTPAEQPPVITAPAVTPPPREQDSARRRPAPVYSFNVPATIPREGVNYTIRWGDTLWDISEAFYRDPWLYPRIAEFNGIRNPNRIISGRTIKVPPRN